MWWQVGISTCAALLAVGCAVWCSRTASEFLSRRNRINCLEQSIEDFESRLTAVAGNVRKHHMRLAHMQSGRADAPARSAAPPIGTPKSELRRHYGLNGLSHADIARRAMMATPNKSEDDE